MIGHPGAVAVGALLVVFASPYLARLSVSEPDREDRNWWRPRAVTRRRTAATALLGAALGALAGSAAGWSPALPALLWLALVSTPLFVIDVEHHRLPDRLVFPAGLGGAALLSAAAMSAVAYGRIERAAVAAAVVFAVFFILAMVAPFGFGDVKLGAVLAGYLGWWGWAEVFYGLLGGFVIASLASLGLVISRRATLKTAIPFGPALILGALLVAGFGLVPGSSA